MTVCPAPTNRDSASRVAGSCRASGVCGLDRRCLPDRSGADQSPEDSQRRPSPQVRRGVLKMWRRRLLPLARASADASGPLLEQAQTQARRAVSLMAACGIRIASIRQLNSRQASRGRLRLQNSPSNRHRAPEFEANAWTLVDTCGRCTWPCLGSRPPSWLPITT